MAMTSSRPYMIRALYEWIVDNAYTPHIVVNALAEGVEVPQQYVNNDGQIVLNIAPRAVESLELGNKAIAFNARFGGIPTDIYVPTYAVMGIYARENGQGMMFDAEPQPEPDPTPPKKISKAEPQTAKRPSLRVVK
ncbi:ClpXP protease specificity-enhancing factor [Teredinibacter sp. KSP-S5-2]|uniref:ClpXP protease specificity-enhancing factor n=1 Tax=Teredinibacter sp. KSP-S5-2 TaxID=3034506 RepID=UPI00293410FB|nr:ClpXP protease specificity-enhancing factor [Teredinibacter sp. KSP-S5-2]WNO08533.1 ClpXP protease specificity-enhancing factor [Teredinibacter sp. KSP-S5-2]